MTAKIYFELLYLVLGLRKIAPWVNCPYAPTTPTVCSTTISRFLCNFFPRMAPHFAVITIHQLICQVPVPSQPLNIFALSGRAARHFLTNRYRNWISWYLDASPSWCQYFQNLGFLTGALATKFALKRVKTRYLTLFRATKNCVVICRVSLLYEMC